MLLMSKTVWGLCYPTHSAMQPRNGCGTQHLYGQHSWPVPIGKQLSK